MRHFKINYLKKFLIANSFDRPRGCSNIPIFHLYNGKDNSQIDYVLQSAPLIDKYLTFNSLSNKLRKISDYFEKKCYIIARW